MLVTIQWIDVFMGGGEKKDQLLLSAANGH